MTDLVDNLAPLLWGFAVTIALNAIGSSLGLLAGVPLGLALRHRWRSLRWPARGFVEAIRNTPFLLQAMIILALCGEMRLRVPPFTVGASAIVLYTSAYMAEIVRGGLASVPAGQIGAATALGLGPWLRFRLILYPQMVPFLVPATANLLSTVIKESAVLAAIAVAELTYQGQVIMARTFAVFPILAGVGGLYLLLVLALLGCAGWYERRLLWTRKIRP